MKKNKIINITPFHFEVKYNTLIVWGVRGKEKNYDQQRYEIHIHFNDLWWFRSLGELCVKHLKDNIAKIQKYVVDIKSK